MQRIFQIRFDSIFLATFENQTLKEIIYGQKAQDRRNESPQS